MQLAGFSINPQAENELLFQGHESSSAYRKMQTESTELVSTLETFSKPNESLNPADSAETHLHAQE